MRKLIGCVSAVALVGLSTGCVVPMAPVGGTIYTDVSGPVSATSNTLGSKMGQASSEGVLGFAWGDARIKTAAANGGITKIQNVDYHAQSVLGVWAKTVVTVYGE